MSSTTDDVVVRLRLKDVAKFVADVKSGRLAVEDLEKKVARAGKTAKKESTEYGGLGLWGATVGRVKYAVAGLALTVGTGAGALAKFGITATSRLEQVEVGFKTLLGSSSAASQMVNKLQDFAAVTPFQLTDLEKQTQMLLGFGMSADAVIPSLTAMGDAVSAFGASSADLDSIILAMGQIATKGHLSYDELRQLNEHKINAAQYLKDSLGVNGSQLQTLIEGKQISSSQAIPIILSGMERQFGGAMDAQSKTLAGIWSNIIDKATRAVTDRVTPFLPMFKTWLTDLYDHIPEIADSIAGAIGKAIKLGKKAWDLGAAVVGKVNSAKGAGGYADLGQSLGQQVPNLTGKILDVATGSAKSQDAFGKGDTAGKNAIGFVFGFLEGIFDLGAWWAVIKKHWVSMLFTIVSLFPIGKVLGIFGKVLSHIPIFKALAPSFIRAGESLTRAGGPVWRLVTKIAKTIWESFTRVFPQVAFRLEYALLRLGEAFGKSSHSLLSRARRFGDSLLRSVVGALSDAVFWGVREVGGVLHMIFVRPIEMMGGAVKSAAKALWRAIPDEFKIAMDGIITKWNGLEFTLPGGKKIGVPKLPYMALGGTVLGAGSAMVGENGPEIVNLPRGASVIPLPRAQEMTRGGGIPPINVTLMLDGQVLMRRLLATQDTAMARL